MIPEAAFPSGALIAMIGGNRPVRFRPQFSEGGRWFIDWSGALAFSSMEIYPTDLGMLAHVGIASQITLLNMLRENSNC